MPIDFPTGPTTGDVYSYQDKSWRYSGTAWDALTPAFGDAFLPAGSIIQWTSSTIPANWLICDGAAVSRNTYSSLFAAIGTTYGAGNGTTTFNLPDVPNGDSAGIVAGIKLSSSVTVTTTATDLPGITLSANLKGGRTYRISFYCANLNASANTRARFDLYANSVIIARDYVGIPQASGGANVNVQTTYTAPADGAYTIKVNGLVDVGTATMTLYADTTSLIGLDVEDMGEAANSSLRTRSIIKASAGTTAGDSELATRLGVAEAAVGQRALSANAIINGAFDIWQRGTSLNLPSGVSSYLADRFNIRVDGPAGTPVYSRQSFTPGSAPVAGYEGTFFARFTTGGNVTCSVFNHAIEDVRTFAGQVVTLSFWMKTSTPKTFTLNLRQDFGSGGSAVVDQTATYTTTTSWQRFTQTFNVASVTGKTIGTNNALWIQLISYTAQTGNFDVDVWGVQLEAGTVATPFRRNAPSLQGELAACQRYYEKSYDLEIAPGTNNGNLVDFYGTSDGSNNLVTRVSFAVPKRAGYTLTTFTNTGVSGQAAYTRSGVSTTATTIPYRFSQGAFHVYVGVGVAWSVANMNFHWTVNAEL
jgi:microcystin-dependent protein